jgi:hypothetical protein
MKISLMILLFVNFNVLANERLVFNVFKAAEREVISLIDFTPRYELEVSENELIDNRGSLVDAIGVPGRITLHKQAWMDFYRTGVDVRLLVLHELLRSQGIDDDNYVHSLPLMEDIYRQEAIKEINRRNSTPYCGLQVSEFTFREKTKRIRATGDSNPMSGGLIVFPNPYAREASENAMRNAKEKCLEKGYESFRYESGHVEMSSTQRNFKSESITRASIRGRCVKRVPKKRRRSDIEEEACAKALACLNTLDSYPEGSGKQTVITKAEQLRSTSCGG